VGRLSGFGRALVAIKVGGLLGTHHQVRFFRTGFVSDCDSKSRCAKSSLGTAALNLLSLLLRSGCCALRATICHVLDVANLEVAFGYSVVFACLAFLVLFGSFIFSDC
jgi:hypothetical protein